MPNKIEVSTVDKIKNRDEKEGDHFKRGTKTGSDTIYQKLNT